MKARIRKIAVAELRPGMYLHDLGLHWMDHPFPRNRFLIDDAQVIERIAGLGVKSVYIDTVKGAGLEPFQGLREEAQEALIIADGAAPVPDEPVDWRSERQHALQIWQEAVQVITDLMTQARLGEPMKFHQVDGVVDDMVGSVFRNQDALIGLGHIRKKDRYTFEHSVSVAALAIAFARALALAPEEVHAVGVGALLHDLGKALTPESILNKAEKLTEAEMHIMRRHVEDTRRLLSEAPGIGEVALRAAAEHHERYDGSGYPDGLAGEQISLYGQIVSICDAYDAITANRCYREGRPPPEVLRWLLEGTERYFEKTLVHRFIRCIGIYPVGSLVRLASDKLAVVTAPGESGLLYPTVRAFYDIERVKFIEPYDIELSAEQARTEQIVSFESPERWGVSPHLVLD